MRFAANLCSGLVSASVKHTADETVLSQRVSPRSYAPMFGDEYSLTGLFMHALRLRRYLRANSYPR
jgi:hypothetical protein